MSFAIAKDMSWFSVDVMAILNHYNNKCDLNTKNSLFKETRCNLEFKESDQLI